jgi:hypothetical protein
MRSVEEIRERIAAHERESAAPASYVPRKRPGRPQTARTREKLSRIAFDRHRESALADPSINALKLARLTHTPALSAEALASKALVGEATIRRAEAGHDASPMTWRRLARALGVSVASLHP